MNPTVRSSLVAAAIAVVFAVVAGLVFDMGTGTIGFAIAMGVIGFVGTYVISTVIVRRR